MEDIRNEQIEALNVMVDYIPKLRKGMSTVADELSGNRLPDTNTYLSKVIDGLNWVIEVLNGTLSYINENGTKIDKDKVNEVIIAFSNAYKESDDAKMATLLKTELTDFLDSFEHTAKELI